MGVGVSRVSLRVRRVGVAGCVVVACAVTGPAWGVANGSAAPEGEFSFAARVLVDEARSCSGVLVAPRWVLTSSTCFASGSAAPVQGPLPAGVRVVVGRTDVEGASREVAATDLVPHPERGVVLVRLARQVRDVPVASLAASAPAVGEQVRVAGYGRTAQEWRNEVLYAGEFQVESVSAIAVGIAGTAPDRVSLCKGDAGGPVVREGQEHPEVVAVVEATWQAGCLGEQETRNGARAVRTDGLGAWVAQVTRENPRGDLNGDGRSDLVALFGCASGEGTKSQMWRFLDVGGSQLPLRYWSGCTEGWSWETNKLLTGDFDGDGKSDLVSIYQESNTAVTMKLLLDAASGKGEWKPGWTGKSDGMGWAGVKAVVGDFTADGRDDIAFLYGFSDGRVALRLFDEVVRGNEVTFKQIWLDSAGVWDWDRTKLVVGDFNADGRSDITAVYWKADGDFEFRLMDAVATPTKEPTYRTVWTYGKNETDWERTTWKRFTPVAGDFTGDGVDDIAALYDSGGEETRLLLFDDVRGGGGLATMWSENDLGQAWDWNRTTLGTGDFNGDGRADIAAMVPDTRGEGSELRVAFDVATKKAPVPVVWRDDNESGGPVWEWERVKFAAVSAEAR